MKAQRAGAGELQYSDAEMIVRDEHDAALNRAPPKSMSEAPLKEGSVPWEQSADLPPLRSRYYRLTVDRGSTEDQRGSRVR